MVVAVVAIALGGFDVGRRCSVGMNLVVAVATVRIRRCLRFVGLWVRRASGGIVFEHVGSRVVVVVSGEC